MLYTLAITILFALFSRNFTDSKRYIWIATALAAVTYTPMIDPIYFALLVTFKAITCWVAVDILHNLFPSAFILRWSMFGQRFMFATASVNGVTQ